MVLKNRFTNSKLRIYLVLFLFAVMAGVIAWRLYHIQIKNGEYYQVLALGQQISFENTPNQRGGIFLKQGQLALAHLKKKYILYVFPSKIPADDLESQSQLLSEALGKEKEELIKLFSENQTIKMEITEEQAGQINKEKSQGVHLNEKAVRFYPQNELASHLLGFVNEEGQGQYGLEGYYDKILQEESVLTREARSPFGYSASLLSQENISSQPAEIALNLTLNYNFQHFAEKLLAKAGADWQIDHGQIIIINPQNGQILALAAWPDFNPNNYFQEENLEIFKNPALQELFEPGSVFKPITLAAGLQENLIGPETVYQDQGFIEVGGPPIYNFEKRVWGESTMVDVLEHSINTGAVFVQQELGAALFLKYLSQFGFFEKTEVDLQGEVFSNNSPLKRGYGRDLAAASFGQGIEITPLQLMRAFGALANGGKLMRPYLVESIVLSSGQKETILPEAQREVISEQTAAKITSMLVSVVENGSGMPAKIPGYYIAGKTGTAQIPLIKGGYQEEGSIQSFIGYFPALQPQFLILIKLDNPQNSRMAGQSAGPIFKEMAQYIINQSQYPAGLPKLILNYKL